MLISLVMGLAAQAAELPDLRVRLMPAKPYADRLFPYDELGRPPEPAARTALISPAATRGVEYDENAARQAVRESAGYPYFVQESGLASPGLAIRRSFSDAHDLNPRAQAGRLPLAGKHAGASPQLPVTRQAVQGTQAIQFSDRWPRCMRRPDTAREVNTMRIPLRRSRFAGALAMAIGCCSAAGAADGAILPGTHRAKPMPPITFPCPQGFSVLIKSARFQVYETTWKGPKGEVITFDDGPEYESLTDLSTGVTLTENVTGPSLGILYPNHSADLFVAGHSIVLFTQAQADALHRPKLAGLPLFTGKTTAVFSATGHITTFRYSGHETNLCSVLSHAASSPRHRPSTHGRP